MSRKSVMLKSFVVASVIICLAGCATVAPEPTVKTVTVSVAVPVACIPPDFPAAPAYTDTLKALSLADDFATRYQLLASNYALHQAREALDEQTIAACRTAK